ncbi:MAG TPA: tetratricopeptide repeat protein [Candidatus Didemnitutus sp.]|jgi:tetratricopeptide (TPR) repeat protein
MKWTTSRAVGLGALAVITVLAGCQPRSSARLPALAAYPRLPASFRPVLAAAHARATEAGAGRDEVRKLGRLYEANGLYAEAKTCFDQVISAPDGGTARDHYSLADIAQNQNDLPRARRELEDVARLDPGYLSARLALAEACFKAGDEEAATKAYTAATVLEPNQPQASLGLARLELQRGDEEAAIARLEELMAAHPQFAAGAAFFAQILERRGESDRAIAFAEISQQKPEPPPADPWAAELLADCYDVQRLSITFEEDYKQGKMKEALPLLDRLAVLAPDSPVTRIFRGFSHAQALEHVAAVREYYDALDRGGDPEKICPYLVRSLLALGRGSEAAKLMADYGPRFQQSQPITKAWAEVALQQGDEKLARALLEQILAREPYLADQNMSLANLLWNAGEKDAAAKCLQRVAAARAEDFSARALLGEYFLGRNRPREAVRPLEEAALHVPPKTPAQGNISALLATAYYQVGNDEAGQEHLAAAADLFEKATHLAPNGLDAWAADANACVQLGQFGRAAAALEKLAALQPDNPTVFLSLGDVVYQDHRPEEARRQWERARQLAAPDDQAIRGALADRLAGRITPDTFK